MAAKSALAAKSDTPGRGPGRDVGWQCLAATMATKSAPTAKSDTPGSGSGSEASQPWQNSRVHGPGSAVDRAAWAEQPLWLKLSTCNRECRERHAASVANLSCDDARFFGRGLTFFEVFDRFLKQSINYDYPDKFLNLIQSIEKPFEGPKQPPGTKNQDRIQEFIMFSCFFTPWFFSLLPHSPTALPPTLHHPTPNPHRPHPLRVQVTV